MIGNSINVTGVVGTVTQKKDDTHVVKLIYPTDSIEDSNELRLVLTSPNGEEYWESNGYITIDGIKYSIRSEVVENENWIRYGFTQMELTDSNPPIYRTSGSNGKVLLPVDNASVSFDCEMRPIRQAKVNQDLGSTVEWQDYLN